MSEGQLARAVGAAGERRSRGGEYPSPLGRTAQLSAAFQPTSLAVVSNGAGQGSGCGECLSLQPPEKGGRDPRCVRCERVGDLLRVVPQLKEEVQRC